MRSVSDELMREMAPNACEIRVFVVTRVARD